MKSIPCLSRTLLFSSLKIPQAAGLVFPSQKDAERVQKEKCCVSTQRYTKYVSMNFILVEVGRSYESFTVHFSALCRRYDTAVENEHLAELMKAVWRLNGLQGYDTTNIQPIYNLRSTRNPLGIHSESTRNPLGIHSESTRNPLGIHSESTRTVVDHISILRFVQTFCATFRLWSATAWR